jgi:hypothetical protein
VSKAKVDLPDPEIPVRAMSLFLGISRLIFFKLCSRAPLMIILSRATLLLILFIYPSTPIIAYLLVEASII